MFLEIEVPINEIPSLHKTLSNYFANMESQEGTSESTFNLIKTPRKRKISEAAQRKREERQMKRAHKEWLAERKFRALQRERYDPGRI